MSEDKKYDERKGRLYINEYKTKKEHPDRQGGFMLDGKEYEIGAWDTVSKKGNEYIWFKINDPYVKPKPFGDDEATVQPIKNPNQNKDVKDDFDVEILF